MLPEITEIIDISQPLSEQTVPWPGDEAFSRQWTARMEEGSSVTLGSFQMSTHLGTHVDAPLHFVQNGTSAEALPLEAFMGPARVVAVRDEVVRPEHVRALEGKEPRRVLFKTQFEATSINRWKEDFSFILPETIEFLAEVGVCLIGTDAPSVDPADSQALPAHHTLSQKGIANLENLRLTEVAPGKYWLSALPLRLAGMDAAPVRAVLFR